MFQQFHPFPEVLKIVPRHQPASPSPSSRLFTVLLVVGQELHASSRLKFFTINPIGYY